MKSDLRDSRKAQQCKWNPKLANDLVDIYKFGIIASFLKVQGYVVRNV